MCELTKGKHWEASNLPKNARRLGSVRAVWGSVLGLAFLLALNPVRLGIILLMISRPRPVPNLLVYWIGCVIACIPGVVLPLMLLHVSPLLKAGATSPTGRHIQLGMGVFALVLAGVLTLRLVRRRAYVPAPDGNASTLVLDPKPPNIIARVLDSAQEAATSGGSPFRRLIGRIYTAWENGSVWVAFVAGIGFGAPAPDLTLCVIAVIAGSGAAIGTQVSAVIAFIVVVLGVVEVVLVSYLVTPAKILARVQLLHDWAQAHRAHIFIVMCALGGISLVAQGLRTH